MITTTSDKEYLYRADGTQKEIHPKNGTYYELDELQEYVGGYIEIASNMNCSHVLIIDEEGKLKGKPLNIKATEIAYGNGLISQLYCIVGDALYINSNSIQ